MIKGRSVSPLPFFPNFARISSKIALGVILVSFFINYQPNLGFPPIKQSVVKAQVEQLESVDAKALSFNFKLPHPGYISTKFSSYHPGIDLATGLGMPIKPIAQGTITDEGYNFWGLGLTVTVDHGGGFKSLYAHMGKIYVQKNQTVSGNDTLGIVGLTGNTSGPHTHLEISKDNKNIDPQTVLPQIRQLPQLEDFQPVSQNNTPNQGSQTPDFTQELKSSL